MSSADPAGTPLINPGTEHDPNTVREALGFGQRREPNLAPIMASPYLNPARPLESLVTHSENEILSEAGKNEVNLKYDLSELGMTDILQAALELGASDIHFSANERIAFRINGEIYFVENLPALTPERAERLIFTLIPTEEQREALVRTRELDTAYEHTDGTNFRVNVFFKRKRLSTVMRVIANDIWSMDELGLPAAITTLLEAKQGLILVTGPTGSGKSTSMQSMIEHINESRVQHIITIEDPIEFFFKSKKSIISQREIGADTLSFGNALRATLREDPDVVMIGEMRDPETIMAAINLSETGHLVLSTLHTSGVSQTISRLINAFPPDQHNMIQNRLADTILGILGQRLVQRVDRKGRVAIYELMVTTPGIRNLVRTGNTAQIKNAIQSGRNYGMIKMDQYAEVLKDRGLIEEKDYIHYLTED